jgi:hypothetical protein
MEVVARALLGEPNAKLSNQTSLRYRTRGSLQIDLSKGTYSDHEADEGGGVLALIKRERGLEGKDAITFLRTLGCDVGDDSREIVAKYDYIDETGALLFQVVRFDRKDFRQRRPDAGGRGWIWSVKGVRQVPYRLPELSEALAQDRRIVIVEGEKDVDRLMAWGVPATCNAGGAGKWREELGAFFAGADVVILPDNDPQAKNHDGSLRFYPDGRPVFPGQDHARDVAAKLAKVARSVRVLELPNLPPKGDVSDWIAAGGTVEQLNRLIETRAFAWENYSPPKAPTPAVAPAAGAQVTPKESPPPTLDVFDAGDDTGPIAPRRWLLGNQFCRKFLSSIVAPGSTGKSALRYLQAIALATNLPLTGHHVFQRCRVLLVSLEDDVEEIRRRIAAVCIHHHIDRGELKGRMFYAAPKGLKLAEMRNGSRQIGHLETLLRQYIKRDQPDIVILDPFVKLHALEENDNGAMDFVCDLLTKLAIEYDIAVDVPHHTKKGTLTAGDADNGRGASGIRDAARLVYTLTSMSEDEAKRFGIPEADRRAYVRLDNAKVNIARNSQEATWLKLVSVRLENGTTEYPNGDEVQTVVPWDPPDTWADLSAVVLNAVLTEIDAGLPRGQRYSNAPKATDRAAWTVVQRHCSNKTEPQCREIIRTWVKNGVLHAEKYHDPVRREEINGLRLDPTKRPG